VQRLNGHLLFAGCMDWIAWNAEFCEIIGRMTFKAYPSTILCQATFLGEHSYFNDTLNETVR
jgi:hypothetical protein